jgi:hypothetical protein
LQEIVIVGNSEKQVKFSELTLDMFRMLQALEREPGEYQPYTLENSADFTKDQVHAAKHCTSTCCNLDEHSYIGLNNVVVPTLLKAVNDNIEQCCTGRLAKNKTSKNR